MVFTTIDASLVPTALQLASYRRPRIFWNTVTSVTMERGLTLTGGTTVAVVLFPDGQIRTTSNATYLDMTITRNAVFSGSNQGGLRSGLSEANDTWYYIYAVKTTNDNSIVIVGDTNVPSRGNIPTLNGLYGTNSWVYLGAIRNGDGSAVPGDILNFQQVGAETTLRNLETSSSGAEGTGIRLAAGSSTSLSWTYDPNAVPGHFGIAEFWVGSGNSSAGTIEWVIHNSTGTIRYSDQSVTTGNRAVSIIRKDPSNGVRTQGLVSSFGQDINLMGWVDNILTGSNWSVNGGD